jgi:Bacterial TniB protein
MARVERIRPQRWIDYVRANLILVRPSELLPCPAPVRADPAAVRHHRYGETQIIRRFLREHDSHFNGT